MAALAVGRNVEIRWSEGEDAHLRVLEIDVDLHGGGCFCGGPFDEDEPVLLVALQAVALDASLRAERSRRSQRIVHALEQRRECRERLAKVRPKKPT